jgi:DNA-binding response OmpR family regulator
MQHREMVGICVLLVEDEPLIRLVTAETLGDAGFVVEEAANAAEAMAKMRAPGAYPHAVIIDLGLPDQPGDVLARNMREIRGDLPILFASGRDRGEIARLFQGDDNVRIVGKPYTGEELVDALSELGVRANRTAD